MPRLAPPVALTIAGSDCSSGAGVQADLKTFAAHGVYGLTTVTCVVAEVPGFVLAVEPMPPELVREQIVLARESFPLAVIKTGMLHSAAVVETVARECAGPGRPPLVVDPVMVASSGDELLEAEAVAVYGEQLFPHATLVTPNLDEARVLLDGQPIGSPEAMRVAGTELCARYGVAFLIKGGHLDGSEDALDLLCLPGGAVHEFRAPFTRGVSTHGTGCTYSAAIAAGLAYGLDLPSAVGQAKRYVTAAIRDSLRWEHGPHGIGALNHWIDPSATQL